jgi:heptosyltransferase I
MLVLPLAEPPRSVCILRLSALGDACHVVPIVRTLQQAWPATQLTWIIGKNEARLMNLIEGIEFITVDKRASLAGLSALRRRLRGRRFEVLLHMQLALRASLAAACVPARVKLGFDRPRARELQWLFTNARIAPRVREHVLDSFFGFPAALGISERLLRWDLPLPQGARAYAAGLVPDQRPTLVISPCSSHPLRNWPAA